MILVVEPTAGSRTELPLERGLLIIGRGSGCDLVLTDLQASRLHAELRRVGHQWLVVDVGSTNGTLVDGEPLLPQEARPLQPGQTIVIGSTRLTLQATAATRARTQINGLRPSVGPAAMRAAAQASPGRAIGAWFSRIAVAAAAILLILGSQRDWVRVRVELPLLGVVVDRRFDGMDSGYGGLLLMGAALALLLIVMDLLSRRWGVAAGLGQTLMAAFIGGALAVNTYGYYRAGSQTIFGISLLDVLTRYARNVVTLTVLPGIYLVAAGLGGLLIGGLLRLIMAGAAPGEQNR